MRGLGVLSFLEVEGQGLWQYHGDAKLTSSKKFYKYKGDKITYIPPHAK